MDYQAKSLHTIKTRTWLYRIKTIRILAAIFSIACIFCAERLYLKDGMVKR
jgi:hypothetical protein